MPPSPPLPGSPADPPDWFDVPAFAATPASPADAPDAFDVPAFAAAPPRLSSGVLAMAEFAFSFLVQAPHATRKNAAQSQPERGEM